MRLTRRGAWVLALGVVLVLVAAEYVAAVAGYWLTGVSG